MNRAYFSARLNADIDRVWGVVGDVFGVAKWVWLIDTCSAPDDLAPHELGAIREYTTRDGLILRDRLVAYDGDGHSLSTESIDTAPFHVSFFVSSVRLSPIIEDGTTFVEWIGDFESEPDVREDAKNKFERLYVGLTGDLRRYLAGY